MTDTKADKETKIDSTETKVEEVKKDEASKEEVSKVETVKQDVSNTFNVGDTVKVNYKIIEGGKERIQPFEGIVIGKKGMGVSKTFTVRRVGAKNIGVERIFPTYSPKIASIDVVKKGSVRRAKLYYLRQQRSKKDAKIKEKVEAKA